MAQFPYRVNLSSSQFPFVSEYGGRTVIIPGHDQNYVRGLTPNVDGVLDENDRGIPGPIYMHNVVPSADGYQTVGYQPLLSAIGGIGAGRLKDIYEIKEVGGNAGMYGLDTAGNGWMIKFTGIGGVFWQGTTGTGAGEAGSIVSTAYINGVTVIFLSVGINQYRQFNFGTNNMDILAPTGIPLALIKGVVAAFGYLIVYNADSVAWSSTTNPFDFTPSLTTGAGSLAIQAIKGSINFCVPHQQGFLIYCSNNVVAALYTGNARSPFAFKEVVGSNGADLSNLVAYDANTIDQYAYTDAGIQKISSALSQTVFPDATDFIAGNVFEDYDESTGILSDTFLAVGTFLDKKVVMIANRYLIFSYGVTAGTYTHALVYDLINKRWGKFKITHVDCFEFHAPDPIASTYQASPRTSIAFVTNTGVVSLVDFTVYGTNGGGVMILGKYQWVRQRMICLEEVAIENVKNSSTFALYASSPTSVTSGKVFSPRQYTATQKVTDNRSRTYNLHKTAMNWILTLEGTFYLSSVIMKFSLSGNR